MSAGLEFQIEPKLGVGFLSFFYSQLFGTPQYPKHSFTGQTVVITGANVGLGLEAARHFYRLGCEKLILACRNTSKGQGAKEDIVKSVRQRTNASAIDVWALDLTSTESTLAFAERAKRELSRIDVLVENAGIPGRTWAVSEGFEQSIQVNVLNTFLLALELLPKLTETKTKFPASSPHLSIVSSEASKLTKFEVINAPDLYEKLNDEKSHDGIDRYRVSKLLEVLLVREIVARLRKTQPGPPPVIINLVSPGLCKSELDRDLNSPPLSLRLMRLLLERTTEVGSRTYVHAAAAGPESHGEFMADGKVVRVESWIYDDVGTRAQKKVYDQTMKVLEARKPGILATVGL